jgi:hypothetical protein
MLGFVCPITGSYWLYLRRTLVYLLSLYNTCVTTRSIFLNINMINVFCSIKVHWLVMKINLFVVNILEIYNLSMKVNWSGGSQSTLYEIQNGAVLVADCLFERLYITITTTVDVHIHIQTMVGLFLPPFVICRRDLVLFTLFVFVCAYWYPTHIVLSWCFCFVFRCLVYPMLPVSLDCSFSIALRYSLTGFFL